MEPSELMDECKKKLGITSDYKLGKLLGIKDSDLSLYRQGLKPPDAYACFKFAEILGKTPDVIIAAVQSKYARSEAKRLYFKGFFSIAVLWVTFAVVSLNFTAFSGSAYADGVAHKSLNSDINAHYAKHYIDLNQLTLSLKFRLKQM